MLYTKFDTMRLSVTVKQLFQPIEGGQIKITIEKELSNAKVSTL